MILFPAKNERIDKFLTSILEDWSRSKLKGQIELGNVLVDNQAVKPSFIVQPGMSVEINLGEEPNFMDLKPVDIPLSIMFEDEYLIVVNKPRGLATHPAPSLKEPSLVNALLHYSDQLSYQGKSFRPGIVHRLDKDTSGLLLIAKKEDVHFKLASEIQEKKTDRRYLAIVNRTPTSENFIIEGKIARNPYNPLKMCLGDKGKESRTYFKIIERCNNLILLGAKLDTGRTHQIRVHLNFVNSPILGDPLYGNGSYKGAMQLHAAYLKFTHPISKEVMTIQSTPPEDFLHHNIPWEKLIKW